MSDLYRAFLKSPNFAHWLQSRTLDVFRQWRQKYVDTLCQGNVKEWVQQKLDSHSDVECIDLLLRLRSEIVSFSFILVGHPQQVLY